jgi:hypothetical protein
MGLCPKPDQSNPLYKAHLFEIYCNILPSTPVSLNWSVQAKTERIRFSDSLQRYMLMENSRTFFSIFLSDDLVTGTPELLEKVIH